MDKGEAFMITVLLDTTVLHFLMEALLRPLEYVIISTFGWGEVFIRTKSGQMFHVIFKGSGAYELFRGFNRKKQRVAGTTHGRHKQTKDIDLVLELVQKLHKLDESRQQGGSLYFYGISSVSVHMDAGEVRLDEDFILHHTKPDRSILPGLYIANV